MIGAGAIHSGVGTSFYKDATLHSHHKSSYVFTTAEIAPTANSIMIGPKNASTPILVGTILALVAALAFVSMSASPNNVQSLFSGIQEPLHIKPSTTKAPAAAPEKPTIPGTEDGFLHYKVFFQEDLKLPNPSFDSKKLSQYRPVNYQGPGRPTFAAYMSTRNSSIHDPYFCGAQQLAYRLLWDPRSR